MKYPTRIYYTETDKGLMWDRWQKGESLNSIARLFDRSHSSIQGVLVRTGGIRLVTDAAKRWAYTNTNIDRWCELSTVPDYVDFDNSIAQLMEGKGLVVQWKHMPVSHYRSKRRKWPKSTVNNGAIEFLKRQEEM